MNNSIVPENLDIKLSRRLLTIAQHIPRNSCLADIGSDHALLPVYAVQQGIVPFAIAGEVNAGPLDAAKRQIRLAGLEPFISARLGDGLDIIQKGEADTVTIAGMGGSTIVSILERGLSKLDGISTMILQPNVGEAEVRRWMFRRGWLLTDEIMIEEDELYYEIMIGAPVSTTDQKQAYDTLYTPIARDGLTIARELQFLMGPHFIRKPNATWMSKWGNEITKRERIIAQMGQSGSAEAAGKRQQWREETDRIREVLACLHMDKP